ILFSMDDKVVDGVFDEGSGVLAAEEPLRIGFVFREQQRGLAFFRAPTVRERSVAVQVVITEVGLGRAYDRGSSGDRLQARAGIVFAPRPTVTEPERGKHVDFGRGGAAIVDADL